MLSCKFMVWLVFVICFIDPNKCRECGRSHVRDSFKKATNTHKMLYFVVFTKISNVCCCMACSHFYVCMYLIAFEHAKHVNTTSSIHIFIYFVFFNLVKLSIQIFFVSVELNFAAVVSIVIETLVGVLLVFFFNMQ